MTTEAGVSEVATDAPPLTDQAAFVEWVRRYRGPEHVWVRQEAEDQARRMLDQFAGRMTAEQAFELGRTFNTDSKGGELRYDRFAPAFHGATMQRVVENLELFNEQVRRLSSTNEDEAVQALDEILRNPHSFPGAGRSLTSVLFYLRDRTRYVPWLDATHRGLAALTGFKGSKRQGGTQAYFAYCEAAWAFARKHGLAPQEIDGVLALANWVDRQRRQPTSPSAAPRLSPEAFAFLADLRANNNAAWMNTNRARYRQSLREPFRQLLQAVAERFIVDLDPQLNTAVKTGEVLASIRKRFPDQEGEYYPYYWGAFSRARKQEDIQLYVFIDSEHLRAGLTFGSAATSQLKRLRAAAASQAEALWLALQPVRDRVQFLLDDIREPIDVQQPADLIRWLDGPTPSAVEYFEPTNPLVTSEGLVDEIGRVLRGLYPVAALAWGKAVPEPPPTDEEEQEEKELEQLGRPPHSTKVACLGGALPPADGLVGVAGLLEQLGHQVRGVGVAGLGAGLQPPEGVLRAAGPLQQAGRPPQGRGVTGLRGALVEPEGVTVQSSPLCFPGDSQKIPLVGVLHKRVPQGSGAKTIRRTARPVCSR